MTSNPAALARLAACYTGIPKGNMKPVEIAILAAWANASVTPPPPPAFSYEPATAIIQWNDKNGSFQTGDLTTFNSTADIPSVTNVGLNTDGSVTSISGLAALPTLSELDATGNSGLTTLDVTGCVALTYLDCSDNNLADLFGVSSCTALTNLYCYGNSYLTALDVAGLSVLTYLDCGSNALTVPTVNTILGDLVSGGATGGTVDLSLQTPPAPPSGAGITAATTLGTRGWTVTTD